jgi:predicted small metal-binding protein
LQGSGASPIFIIYQEEVWLDKWTKKDVLRMMSLNCRDIGMGGSVEITGMNEQEVMRKFIDYAEMELKMPVLSCDTIFRMQKAIKR